MKKILSILLVLCFTLTALGTTYYVAVDGSDTSPYDTWAKAATNIQDAIDVAEAAGSGNTVMVSNGVYDTGGIVYDFCGIFPTNRVVLTNETILISVNGPEYTMISGEGTSDYTAVRCILNLNGFVSGFTLSNGATLNWRIGTNYWMSCGGGLYQETNAVCSNMYVTKCFGNGAGIYGGTIYNSTIEDCGSPSTNWFWGGGFMNANVYDSTVKHCKIYTTGGAGYSTSTNRFIIRNCLIASNETSGNLNGSAGALRGTWDIANTSFVSNWANRDGGAIYLAGNNPKKEGLIISNCIFRENRCGTFGGAICAPTPSGRGNWASRIYNCLFEKNVAKGKDYFATGAVFFNDGGQTYQPFFFYNCTFVSNISGTSGYGGNNGTIDKGQAENCIFFGNTRDAHYPGWIEGVQYGLLLYTRTQDSIPTNTGSTGNIIDDPLFVDNAGDYHLQSGRGVWDETLQDWVLSDGNSPCIDAGDPNSAYDSEPEPNGYRINMGYYGNTPHASKSWPSPYGIDTLDQPMKQVVPVEY